MSRGRGRGARGVAKVDQESLKNIGPASKSEQGPPGVLLRSSESSGSLRRDAPELVRGANGAFARTSYV